ncbi:MAG: MBL fold metallo-hydrolase, partial [Spirochaetales bacterium]|nr:MBL fold metallo-hydrolase [Spirochaetales bacterium]
MKITKLKLSVTNCFLVRTGDKYILVDTGYDWEWEVFCSRLKEVRVSFADISHIILTHHHDDHSGLLNNILTENPGIKLVMSRHAKNLLLKGKNDDTNGGGYLNKRVKI